MKLPKDILNKNCFEKPNFYLCESDKTRICKLEVSNSSCNFKFNSYSELSFDVYRTYNDLLTGELKINPYYDKIEALRLVEVEGFGLFEIQGPTINSDGINEYKSVTAYGYEYTLSQKYLENFNINTGKVDSLEVLNADDPNHIVPITLYNKSNGKLSLVNLALEKMQGWNIGHVDESLTTMSRQFEIDRMSIYDFFLNEICEKFNCYIQFVISDNINEPNIINIYEEKKISKFIGDGKTKIFNIFPPFKKIDYVVVDGYKTSDWNYDTKSGDLTFNNIPAEGSMIEAIDGYQEEWETDVFCSFENLAQETDISYNADDIKTVLNVEYGDGLDIREINLGRSYITDLSYYYNIEWMGSDLYNAYTNYLKIIEDNRKAYEINSEKIQEILGHIDFEKNRLGLKYAVATVDNQTVGEYYIRGGNSPEYFYTKVSLPAEYNVNQTYYRIDGEDLNEKKVNDLYMALRDFFKNGSTTKLSELTVAFSFMENNTIQILINNLNSTTEIKEQEIFVNNFLDEMWDQVGQTPLEKLYLDPYKKVQVVNLDAGWSQEDSENYKFYYTLVLLIESIERAIDIRIKKIESYKKVYDEYKKQNIEISKAVSFERNFTKPQLIKLNSFLREDEIHLDDIVETDQTSLHESYTIKKTALENAKIELSKISQPQLQFTMTLDNIFALSEFEPIIDQFQLGKIIKISIRKGYIKSSRLLNVHLNFEDFSDFSCEFGELTNVRNQSDIHADLLKGAIQAGKSVATFSDYWNKGADKATATDIKIHDGLLDAVTSIKSMDGTQDVVVDNYGIHLLKRDPKTGELDSKQGWITNNKFLYSSDGFRTTNSVFGEYIVPMEGHPDGVSMWGLLAQAVIAGYIEGSQIVGGTIKIGLQPDGSYAFEVHEDGSVTMNGGTSVDGKPIVNQNDIDRLQGEIDNISNRQSYTIQIISTGNNVIMYPEDKISLKCVVYSWDNDITETLPEGIFNWKRASASSEQDIIWNSLPEHLGKKSIIITADDVVENASFYCEVNLP